MTGRGFKVFTLLGIPVHVDWTFFVVVPLFTYLLGNNLLAYANVVGLGPEAADLVGLSEQGAIARPGLALVFGGLMTLGLYASVLVHEFGHALTARLFGVRTERVLLWFLGGIAGFDRMPRQPGAEAIVAIVGPLTSFAIAGLLAIAMAVVPDGFLLVRLTLGALSVLNLVLAVFNLLPALPLDGGRVLRSLLALPLSYLRATQIASAVSRVLAIGLVLLGLYNGEVMMIAIAVFVWMAVKNETRQSRMEDALGGVLVGQVMSRNVVALPPTATVDDLVRASYTTRHDGFPVVDGEGRVLGMALLADAHAEDGSADPGRRVGEIMRASPYVARPNEAALAAIESSARAGLGRCAVVDADGRLVGVLTKDDLVLFLQQQSFRRSTPGPFASNGSPADPYRPPSL